MATRNDYPAPALSASIANLGTSNLRAGSTDESVPGAPTPPDAGPRAIAKINHHLLQDYLLNDFLTSRENAREKIARLTRQQFQELNTDVCDEVIRRNNNKKGGVDIPFLPIQDNFHPKRNQARQKLATLPPNRFKDLISDVFYELRRRYPEFKEPEPLSGVPDIPINASPHEPHTSDTTARDSNTQQSSPIQFVVPSSSSPVEMFRCLLEHGCADVSSRMNPDRHSITAVAGGSFGDIWASEMDDGTKIAIKCLRFHVIPEDCLKGLKRATREIYMWSKAKHPNVHELVGVTMFQGRLGMVSMWMENGSLDGYIRKNPSVDRYQLCVQVTAGVSYLHGIKMVHGDIKALNTLVSRDGIAKLSDFDHSILWNSTLAFSSTTNVGGGTLRWMAPELLLSTEDGNSQPIARNMQTDVYALGMTMLEVITGKIPYSEFVHDHGVYRALDRKTPPLRPKELADTNERANQLWALLLQCWDHDLVARPDASSVLASLTQIMDGRTD